MIILDTNVVSEAMKPTPHPGVLAWLDRQNADTLYLSSVTLAEWLFDISLLPAGRRKEVLDEALNGLLSLFGERVLPFDTDAARHFADLAIKSKVAGKGFPTADGSIAAIASARGFIVATRDVSFFQAAGLNVINPWESYGAPDL